MGYYIRRPVEDAVIRIIDAKEKAVKYRTESIEQQKRDIEIRLQHKTVRTLTAYDRHLVNRYALLARLTDSGYYAEEFYRCS